jgi:hypothetical protein
MRKIVLAGAFILLATLAAATAENFGHFVGELVLTPMDDGRNMKLVQPYAYVDPKDHEWPVPAGEITDGASVPKFFWAYYAPFTGNYRNAAVIHDYYCVTKSATWEATHLLFYNAMRAANVAEKDAKILYAAVYYFGPRWGVGSGTRGPGAQKATTPEQQRELFEQYKTWIEQNNPPLGDIEDRLDNAKT